MRARAPNKAASRAGRRLAWAWAALAATLMFFGTGLALFVVNGSLPLPLAVFLVVELAFPAVGFYIVYRTNNLIGWLFLLAGLGLGLQAAFSAYGEHALAQEANGAGAVVITWLSEVVWLPQLVVATMLLFLFFPNGRLPSPRWRIVLFLGLVGTLLVETSVVFEPTLYSHPKIRAPLAGVIPPSVAEILAGIGSFILFPALLASFLSLVFRYRVSNQMGRAQIKWFIYAASAYLAGQVVFNLMEVGENSSALTVVSGLSALVVPVSVAIAIMRYRLYDIDLIIRRTLVYALLTAILLGSYLAAVFGLGRALDPLTKDSDVAVAASTLIAAALFRPLRTMVQGFIDRRFYRRKYDAGRALATFGKRLRDQVDIEAVRGDVLSVVGTTLQPSHASLWLNGREPL
ncbi:MAG: hypothetical protein ABR505_02980 [Actinomycetota bacterium]